MKTMLKWLNNPVLLGILLVAVLSAYLISLGQAYDLSRSDWAAWVGALGTVATLVGTIHLATAETRRRVRQENLAAELHGVLLSSRLAHVEARLETTRRLLSKAIELENVRAVLLKECHAQVAAIDIFTPEEVLPIAVLGGGTGASIVRSAAALVALRHLSSMLGALDAPGHSGRAQTMLQMVTDNQELLADAVKTLRGALKQKRFLI